MNIWHFDSENITQLDSLASLPIQGYVWLDCQSDELAELNLLLENLTDTSLYDSHLEDCLNVNHPCAYDTTTHYDILIFHSLINHDIHTLTTQPVVFILYKQILITLNHQDENFLAKQQIKLQINMKRLPNTPYNLAYFILNSITDQFLDLRKPLSQYIIDLQAELLNANKPFANWTQLFAFKANLRRLGMVCEDQHDAIEKWRQDLSLVTNDPFMVRLNDLLNHSLRASRHANMIEDEMETLVELHYSVINYRTSEIMRLLTILSAIFLPLSFVTGIFGMNFEHMPILHSRGGYYACMLGMGLLSLGLLAIFKWKKWI
jgi:magnesium transporter